MRLGLRSEVIGAAALRARSTRRLHRLARGLLVAVGIGALASAPAGALPMDAAGWTSFDGELGTAVCVSSSNDVRELCFLATAANRDPAAPVRVVAASPSTGGTVEATLPAGSLQQREDAGGHPFIVFAGYIPGIGHVDLEIEASGPPEYGFMNTGCVLHPSQVLMVAEEPVVHVTGWTHGTVNGRSVVSTNDICDMFFTGAARGEARIS